MLLEEVTGLTATALAIPHGAGAGERGFGPGEVLRLPLTAGNFGTKEGRASFGQGALRRQAGRLNYWARPIEGLFATIDESGKVLDVPDSGAVPVSGEAGATRMRCPRAAHCGRK